MEYEGETIQNDQPAQTEPARDWLKVAADSFSSSTTYMDANWRKSWEDNLAMFQSRHPAGSKYNSDLYKARSHIFRPKTRSVIRKNEAAAAAAFFSNVDVVSIEAENSADKLQQASSELVFQLINYRLQKSIPWFKVLIGALQEAQIYGIVASYQYWDYKEKPQEQEQQDEFGQTFMVEAEPKILCDKPCVELIPLENIRFDPGADWLDVVKSTPYLIRQVPMYVTDVKQMMKRVDRKTGQPKWKQLSDGEIRQAMTDFDSLRQQRENRREDPKSENAPLTDFEIVWCHENFVRLDGEEVVYWTMGTQHMLTEPTALEEVYFTGERPIVIGSATIEAHRAVPDALVQLGGQLQREANDIVNQRMDNVKLILNKRWFVKRGKNVDVPSLHKNAAGSVTMVDDIEGDVKEVNWPDVTSSAYQEQDRINVDYDELVGNFSGSSVMTNRKLNETVGGMSLLNGGASQLTEYMLRTFVETWVEPVLRHLVKLEQAYETDLVILGLAGKKAQLFQKYKIDRMTDDLLNQELTVRVNVGMGATDPQTKLQKFSLAVKTYAEVAGAIPNAELEAVRKEIFGLAGYRDGARFFKEGDDPAAAQIQQMQQGMQEMQQVIAELQQALKSKQTDNKAKMLLTNADVDLKEAQTVKTLVDAMITPSQQLVASATTQDHMNG